MLIQLLFYIFPNMYRQLNANLSCLLYPHFTSEPRAFPALLLPIPGAYRPISNCGPGQVVHLLLQPDLPAAGSMEAPFPQGVVHMWGMLWPDSHAAVHIPVVTHGDEHSGSETGGATGPHSSGRCQTYLQDNITDYMGSVVLEHLQSRHNL